MIKNTSTALLRIFISVFPIVFVFLVTKNNTNNFSKQILYIYSFVNLISIASKSGLEPYINQVFSSRFFIDHFFRDAAKLMLKTAAICFALSLAAYFLVIARQGTSINIFAFSGCSILLTTNALSIHFLQSRKAGLQALLIGQAAPYSALLLVVIYILPKQLDTFYLFFLVAFLASTVLSLMFLGWIVHHNGINAHCTAEERPTFRFTKTLWLATFTGKGRSWIYQTFLALILSSETYVQFMELLRIAQIPMAALVGTNFFAHTLLNHKDMMVTALKKYKTICRMSTALALLSIAALPIYFYFFSGAGDVHYNYIFIAWFGGLLTASLGPIGALLNTYMLSRYIVVVRIFGLIILLAFMFFIKGFSILPPSIVIVMVILLIEFCEKANMLKKFFSIAKTA